MGIKERILKEMLETDEEKLFREIKKEHPYFEDSELRLCIQKNLNSQTKAKTS